MPASTEQPADQSPHAFNALRENGGMVAMAVVVLVTWLLFRRFIKTRPSGDS